MRGDNLLCEVIRLEQLSKQRLCLSTELIFSVSFFSVRGTVSQIFILKKH